MSSSPKRWIAACAALLLAAGCDFSPGLDKVDHLEVTQNPPVAMVAGTPFDLEVKVVDKDGNVVTRYDGEVTLGFAPTSVAGQLVGTTTQPAVSGVAVFEGLALTQASENQRILVRSAPKGDAKAKELTLPAITVSPGPPQKVGVLTQPGNAAPNGLIAPAPVVRVEDAHGNVVSGEAVTVTAALGANPTGATLGGTTSVATSGGNATFADLSVNNAGTGYTLQFSVAGLAPVTSSPFDVRAPTLVYTDPATGIVRLVKNAASTPTTIALDLVAAEAIPAAFAAGLNLPLDVRTVTANAALFTPGTALSPGAVVPAAIAALRSAGPMPGVLTAGISQKAAGAGAVSSNTSVPAGTVFFTVRLDVSPTAPFVPVFDGAGLPPTFRAAVRDAAGEDVVPGYSFGIGKLQVQ